MEGQDENEFDFLRGKTLNDKERRFFKRLKEIEKAYDAYFANRPSPNNQEEHDRLHNHYFYNQYDNVVDLKWINDSDLDSEIKEEVEQALKKAFQ